MKGQAQHSWRNVLFPLSTQSLFCTALGSSELGMAQGQVSLYQPGTPP